MKSRGIYLGFFRTEGREAQMQEALELCLFRSCCCIVTKSCLTPCNPMDCSSPGSSVHGILQARILEFLSAEDLPHPGMEPVSLALQADSLPLSHLGSPCVFRLDHKMKEAYKGKTHKATVRYLHCFSSIMIGAGEKRTC